MLVKKFSDFAKAEIGFNGDKLKIDEILGRDIIVENYKIGDSKYNDKQMLTIQFKLDGVDYIVFTGSRVLMNQCEKYKDEMPFGAKIEKVNKYYTFT